MAQKRKTEQSEFIAQAALSLADKTGWKSLTLKTIAKKAKLPEKAVAAQFKDTWAILRHVLQKLEKDTAKNVQKRLGKNWRDNLFEILMTRFDLAQKHRAAFKSLPHAFIEHPRTAAHFVKPFYKTMQGMLELSGMKKSRCRQAHIAVFTLLYLSVVDAWMKDDTADLSKTMAATDKRLEMFESLINAKDHI